MAPDLSTFPSVGFQSSPPRHSMPGGAVEQFSSQVWSALQYHCSEPRLMHEPAQCLWGTPTGSEKDIGGSFRAWREPAIPDDGIAAKERIAQAHFRAA
ncbi:MULTISPECIES: hypothetical protein [unclassified Methylobacterium]|jgi:hypothetical protein|uniref:hypothetical protein n=1 Tax=unclassified Methylobacterium TaxID=2615210 RepID=UPI0005BA30AC|nr:MULTISPECIES: hypothetical protein [unclassified Methylobacterium]SFU94421.1 hypothetical protein SAMN02799643_03345 [Methylobacterium sp. UNCCL125]